MAEREAPDKDRPAKLDVSTPAWMCFHAKMKGGR